MEVSSTSINAAIATVAAITHGLVFGFHAVMGTAAAAAAMGSFRSCRMGSPGRKDTARRHGGALMVLLYRCKNGDSGSGLVNQAALSTPVLPFSENCGR
jgi:hypothetical protein